LEVENGLGRITSSIVIERLCVFTRPRPKGDIGSLQASYWLGAKVLYADGVHIMNFGWAMRRRDFIAGLGIAVAMPPISHAQQQPPTIGFLSSRSPAESEAVAIAFREGLAGAGFVVGKNVAIEYRWAEGHYDRLPALAAELVGIKVAVILAAGGPPSALAAQKATSTIPIIFSATGDPVGLGLVASLNRPGGNVTGMSLFNETLLAKRLELLHELVPSAKTVGYLINPTNPTARSELEALQAAAKSLGIDLKVLQASTDQEIDSVFRSLAELHAEALVVAGEPYFDSRRAPIVALAAKHAIPVSYSWRENVVIGGLFSYGTSIVDSYRDSGVYCSRVLRGEQPADLPVMQPTRFQLVVNLKAARSLALSVPPALLTSADEVIE
jgi:putative ABC transport system substrate-binding protein